MLYGGVYPFASLLYNVRSIYIFGVDWVVVSIWFRAYAKKILLPLLTISARNYPAQVNNEQNLNWPRIHTDSHGHTRIRLKIHYCLIGFIG